MSREMPERTDTEEEYYSRMSMPSDDYIELCRTFDEPKRARNAMDREIKAMHTLDNAVEYVRAQKRTLLLTEPDGDDWMDRLDTIPVLQEAGDTLVDPEVDDRLEAALFLARMAFWQQIRNAYPEVESGDMAPDQLDAFEDATVSASKSWLQNNLGSLKEGDLAD